MPGGVARLACTMVLISCAGARPAHLGLSAGGLAPCPASPNCVSSDAADSVHAIPPLDLAVAPEQAWRAVRAALERMPRTRVVTDTGGYLHAECTSAIFRFVDDLELQLRADEGRIAVRSASRLGYGDMGVNRRRVEELRALLTREGLLASAPCQAGTDPGMRAPCRPVLERPARGGRQLAAVGRRGAAGSGKDREIFLDIRGHREPL